MPGSIVVHKVDPYNAVLAPMFAFSAVQQIVGGPSIGALDYLLPPPLRIAMLACFALSAVACFIGVCQRSVAGMMTESLGLQGMAIFSAIYGAALTFVAYETIGWHALASGPLSIVLSVAFGWRARQIEADLEALRKRQ